MTHRDNHDEIACLFDDALARAVETYLATHPTPVVPDAEDAFIAVDHGYLDGLEPDGEG